MKKRIIIIPLASLTLIMLSAAAYVFYLDQRDYKQFKACQIWKTDEGKSCANDDECTFFDLGCGGIPVNKKTLLFMDEQCVGLLPQVSCKRGENDTKMYVQRCKAGRCISEERENGNGF